MCVEGSGEGTEGSEKTIQLDILVNSVASRYIKCYHSSTDKRYHIRLYKELQPEIRLRVRDAGGQFLIIDHQFLRSYTAHQIEM